AVGAPAARLRSVDVRAGEAAVQGNLADAHVRESPGDELPRVRRIAVVLHWRLFSVAGEPEDQRDEAARPECHPDQREYGCQGQMHVAFTRPDFGGDARGGGRTTSQPKASTDLRD